MAEIFEFPKKQEDCSGVRLAKTAEAVERVINAIFENRLEEKNTIADIDALKDIFSMLSVKENETIERLSALESEEKITKHDKLLLFSIFLILKNSNSQEAIYRAIEGSATEENLGNMQEKIKAYLLDISKKQNIEATSGLDSDLENSPDEKNNVF